jgi:5-methylcytosine-specific restriction endonuclease McrA
MGQTSLATLKPGLATLRNPLAPPPPHERDRYREINQPWRQWYRSARWARLRWQTFIRDLFTCQRCGRIEENPSNLVAHHKIRHRGNPVLFWDAANLETACAQCHSGDIQAEEQRGGGGLV